MGRKHGYISYKLKEEEMPSGASFDEIFFLLLLFISLRVT
jgi:hypothetical protein